MTAEKARLTAAWNAWAGDPEDADHTAEARAAALREVADDAELCAEAGWSSVQIAAALNNRAIQAERAVSPVVGGP